MVELVVRGLCSLSLLFCCASLTADSPLKCDFLVLTNSPEPSAIPHFQYTSLITVLIEAGKHPWESFNVSAQLLCCAIPCCLPANVDSPIVLQ